jgi:hypothetical protein
MIRTLAARFRKLRGRQTDLDEAFEEWADFRADLRRAFGYQRATRDGGWLDYAEEVFAASAALDAPRPIAVRMAALEVFEHVVYHGGVVHAFCSCDDYKQRVQERSSALLAGRQPPLPPFALPGDPRLQQRPGR